MYHPVGYLYIYFIILNGPTCLYDLHDLLKMVLQVFERFKSYIGALTFTINHDRKCISKVYNTIPVIDKGRLLIL